MLRFRIDLTGHDEAARAAGDFAARLRRSPRPLVEEIARAWAEDVFPAVFDRGGEPRWQPLSDVSVRLRGPARPLTGKGILRNSFRVEEISEFHAVVGNEYGAIHQLGGRTSPDSMIPGKPIPERPFLRLDETAISQSLETISGFYFGEIS